MERDPDHTDAAGQMSEADQFAVLRHQFRNRVQTMTSLVGLFGRRHPAGPCRSAFEDLRARFEAVTFPHNEDEAASGAADEAFDLAELARRIVALLEPGGVSRVSISGDVIRGSRRRGAALAQILAELLIDLIRNGLDDSASAAGEATIEARADGGVRLRVAQTGSGASARGDATDLGLSIARSMAASLGGALSRSREGPLVLEVVVPPQAHGS